MSCALKIEAISGVPGSTGPRGWTPVFALESDGERRVLKVSDWTGSGGTKPTTGVYVGASGFTPTKAIAVDVRGDISVFGTISGMESVSVPAGVNAITVNGATTEGDGLGGFFVDNDNGGTDDTFMSGDGRTWYRASYDVRAWSKRVSQPLWADGRSFRSAIIIGDGAAPAISPDNTSNRSIVAFGHGALNAADANTANQIAIGNNTLSQGLPGEHNIAIGDSAMTYLNAGERNLGVGSLALHFLTSGSFNTFVGRNSGHALTTGSNNVGLGYRACGVGNNPIGFDGKIVANWQLTASDMTGIGMDALRYSNGQFNTAGGKIALFNVKGGARNVAWGAGALTLLDKNVSYSAKTLDWTTKSGTYSQSGATVAVSITGANAVVGNQVLMDFATGAYSGISGIAVTVLTAPTADTFTFASPVSQTTSGDCSLQWVETAVSATNSSRNTAFGHNAGGELESGSFNVFIGADSGQGQGASHSNKFLVHVNSANARPLAAGDFATGYFAVGGGIADATTAFGVLAGGKRILDLERSAAVSRLSTWDDGSAAGPVWELMRESASPAASDLLGAFRWRGRDSAGVDTNYADMFGTILSATDGAEAAQLSLRAMVAGSMSTVVQFGNGIVVGSATGGMQGAGTVNLDNALYRDGIQVVGSRQPGWAAATGTATRTTYATGSVTLPQLAERVKALIDDLTTHGLIGA